MASVPGLESYVKVLLTYDVNPEMADEYYQFMLGQLVPAAQQMGLGMVEAWHTAVGNYPIRLIAFVAEDRESADQVLDSEEWLRLEGKLQEFVLDYRRRVVPLRNHFQF